MAAAGASHSHSTKEATFTYHKAPIRLYNSDPGKLDPLDLIRNRAAAAIFHLSTGAATPPRSHCPPSSASSAPSSTLAASTGTAAAISSTHSPAPPSNLAGPQHSTPPPPPSSPSSEPLSSAISSVSAIGIGVPASNGSAKGHFPSERDEPQHEQQLKAGNAGLKLYQIKAQKLLDDLLSKSLEIVRDPVPILNESNQVNEGCIRLFRKAPPGMTIHSVDPHSLPRKKPRILPGEDINEKSKKFKHQLRSVAVDGADILATARDACQRSQSRFEAKDAAAKAAAKREEERVAELRKCARVRGEGKTFVL